MKSTDINKVRDMAITFAYSPVEPHEKLPFFVSHPFTDSSLIMLQGDNGPEPVNLLERDGQERFRKEIVQRLKNANTVVEIILMINKAYMFTFLDHIKSYLSKDDLAVCLRYVWKHSEHANSGIVFTKKQLVSLFSRSKTEKMMDDDELSVVRQLPERVTVYRGVTSANCKDLKVFSWTLSLERAKWFAARFDDKVQKVFLAELPKDGVLAYFSDEEEIIANPFKLENIQDISA